MYALRTSLVVAKTQEMRALNQKPPWIPNEKRQSSESYLRAAKSATVEPLGRILQ